MRLNNDCIREVMLYLENNLELDGNLDSTKLPQAIPNYSADDIIYSVSMLVDAEYLSVTPIKAFGMGPMYIIQSITWTGHEFLDNVRELQVWKETKQITSNVGNVSLNILSQVASSVITKALGI